MKCPECESENPEGKKYCGECGEELPQPEHAPEGCRYCAHCGKPVTGKDSRQEYGVWAVILTVTGIGVGIGLLAVGCLLIMASISFTLVDLVPYFHLSDVRYLGGAVFCTVLGAILTNTSLSELVWLVKSRRDHA